MRPETFVTLFIAGTGLVVVGAIVTVVVIVVRALPKRKRPPRPAGGPRFATTDSEPPARRLSFSDTIPSSDARDGGSFVPALLGAAAVAVGDALLPETDRSSDDGGDRDSSSSSDSDSSSSSDDSASSSSSGSD